MTMAYPHEPITWIALICGDLDEAQAFLPDRPTCAAGRLRDAAEDICRLVPMMRSLRPWCSMAFMFDRLRFNLKVAAAHAQIAPDVAAAYAKGCRFELGQLAEELAKHPEGVCR